MYPSRIIVGYPKMIDLEGRVSAEENAAVRAIGNPEAEELARIFARLLHEGALKEEHRHALHGHEGGRGGGVSLPTLIWHCVCRISMNWIHMPR